MNTECKPKQLEFQSLGRREVIGRFDGGRITSDGGGLLLREVGSVHWIARSAWPIVSPITAIREYRTQRAGAGGQRVYGLALGYEDLNDHDGLRKDSTWPSGWQAGSDRGTAGA